MVTSKAKTVSAYLAQSDPSVRPALEAFRMLIRRSVPKAVESMDYGMPTYTLGAPLAAFNAQKHYLSFYVCDTELVAARKKDLGGIECGKSCLRGKCLEQFPLDVIADMLHAAARRQAATSKPAPRKKTARKATRR